MLPEALTLALGTTWVVVIVVVVFLAILVVVARGSEGSAPRARGRRRGTRAVDRTTTGSGFSGLTGFDPAEGDRPRDVERPDD